MRRLDRARSIPCWIESQDADLTSALVIRSFIKNFQSRFPNVDLTLAITDRTVKLA